MLRQSEILCLSNGKSQAHGKRAVPEHEGGLARSSWGRNIAAWCERIPVLREALIRHRPTADTQCYDACRVGACRATITSGQESTVNCGGHKFANILAALVTANLRATGGPSERTKN